MPDADGYTPEFYAAQAGAEDCVTAIANRTYEIEHVTTEQEAQAALAAAHDEEERIVDADSGHAYYLNMRTGESRWETAADYELWEAKKRHDVLRKRKVELASRRRVAEQREAAKAQRAREKRDQREDAMDYFSTLVKLHIAPQEAQLKKAEERKYAATKVQAAARTREAKMRAKAAAEVR